MDGIPVVQIAGQTTFGQFKNLTPESEAIKKVDWTYIGNELKNITAFDINVTINYSAVALDFKLFISTIDLSSNFLCDKPANTLKTFEFSNLIKKISSNTSYCLVLLENGEIFQVLISSFEKRQLNFLNVVQEPSKKSIFGLNTDVPSEWVTDIACNENICVAISSNNSVYNVPNRTFQFEKQVKIRMVCCGVEHALLLTGNGDVYTWGIGLRGQLGHCQIGNEEVPKLVEGLSGIKITHASAGGWSSAAVSAFGDLYVWGWNSCGQLGLRVFDTNSTNMSSTLLKRKLQTVYTAPTLITLEEPAVEADNDTEINVSKVYCGTKHTVIYTTDNRIFVTGSNSYNQLGLTNNNSEMQLHQGRTKRDVFIDQFKELKLKCTKEKNIDIQCAYSCTVFIQR